MVATHTKKKQEIMKQS